MYSKCCNVSNAVKVSITRRGMISLRVTNDSVALTRVHLPSEETKSFSKRGVIRQRQYPSCIPVSLYPQRYARIVPSLVSRLVEFSAICSSSIRLGTRRAVNVVLWPAAYSGKTKKKGKINYLSHSDPVTRDPSTLLSLLFSLSRPSRLDCPFLLLLSFLCYSSPARISLQTEQFSR